jgi:hypothetical protein
MKDIFGHNVWVRMLCDRNRKSNIVISDVRFPNECEWIKRSNGLLIKLVRGVALTEYSEHVSEQLMDDIKADCVISNDDTLDVLYANVDSFLRSNGVRKTFLKKWIKIGCYVSLFILATYFFIQLGVPKLRENL